MKATNNNTNVTKKENKTNISDILNTGKDVITRKQGNTKSIYKKDLFDGLSDKEKKSARVKLRRKLQSFVGEFLQSQKNEEKLTALKKAWKDYSVKVYDNAEHIFDGNTTPENIENYKKFLSAMKK